MSVVTVFRCQPDKRATKKWSWNLQAQGWILSGFDAGTLFTAAEYPVASMGDLVEVLDTVQWDSRSFVVSGKLTDAGRSGGRIRRLKLDRDGAKPTLCDGEQEWFAVDIDKYPMPGWANLVDDPELIIEYAIRELLPENLWDCGYYWQLSSSAGFSSGTLSVHIFFWTNGPVTNARVKAFMREYAQGVDLRIHDEAQAIYVAPPIIEGGHDPLPRRTGWRKGAAAVLPDVVPQAARGAPKSGGQGTAGGLECLGDGLGGGGFHVPLRNATYAYAVRCCRGFEARDDDRLVAELLDAIAGAPKAPARKNIGDYNEYELRRLIDGAFDRCALNPERLPIFPPVVPATRPAEEARAALSSEVGRFVERALEWHRLDQAGQVVNAECLGLRVTTGIGKSTAARAALGHFNSSARLEGVPARVLWLVPRHSLGNESLAAMQDLGLNVAAWRGRAADDPDGGKMCRDLVAVDAARAVGADVELAACGSGTKGKPSCRHRAVCGYQRQKAAAAAADVLIAAHQTLFHPLPQDVGRNIGLVVVDEGFWQSGLNHREIPLGSFAEVVAAHPVLRAVSVPLDLVFCVNAGLADNRFLLEKAQVLKQVLSDQPDGFIDSSKLTAAGFTPGICGLLGRLEWARKRERAVTPGMSAQDRNAAVEAAAGNAGIAARAALWEVLEALLTGDEQGGRVRLDTCQDGHRVIRLHQRHEVRDELARLPTLLLDATLPGDIVKCFMARLDATVIEADAPYMTVHQTPGPWSKRSLTAKDAEGVPVRLKRLDELKAFVRLRGGRRPLVITYQACESHFADLDGVSTLHFGAVSGLDTHKDCTAAFIIGRPMADGYDTWNMALALTGQPIPRSESEIQTRGVLMADGSTGAVEARAFADCDLEMVRSAITDAALIQAIGRGRGVNRTAENPLTVFLMAADVVLPLRLTTLTGWEHAKGGVWERMAAEGVVFTSATHAAAAYPEMFASVEAAKKALQRAAEKGEFGDIALLESPIRGCPRIRPFAAATYRLKGRGQQNCIAYVSAARLPDFEQWLESRFGPLAFYNAPCATEPVAHHQVERAAEPIAVPQAAKPVSAPWSGQDQPRIEVDDCYPWMDPANGIGVIEHLVRLPRRRVLARFADHGYGAALNGGAVTAALRA